MRTGLLLVLLGAAAAAQDAPADLVERLRQHKIERFFAAIEENATLDAAVKERVLRLREGATLGGEFGCIHRALLEIHPDYRRADAMLLDERFAAAAELFDALASSEDEYLRAYALFRYGLAEMNREHFETAVGAFTTVLNRHGSSVGCDIESAFYLAVCLGQSREKEKAIVAAQRFLDDYPDAPMRYRAAMEQMKNELMREWESPLYDLAGRMTHVARRIDGGDTGDRTQAEQKEIVEILDELIRRAEQNEGQGQGGGGGGGPPNNNPPNNPADRTTLPPGASETGDLRPKPPAKAGEQWGEMRDKEREEVLQALKEKFPERYRELLEQYHRALAEGKRVAGAGAEAEPAAGER